MKQSTSLRAALSAVLSISGGAAAWSAEDHQDQQLSELRSMVETLRSEVDVLRSEQHPDWLTQRRTEQIRGLVQDVLADADTRAALQGKGATSGYNNGFFIESADGAFKMRINGQLQSRYMFNRAEGQPDDYGFEMRRVKVKFQGHLIDPSLTWKITINNQRNAQGGISASMYVEDAWLSKKYDDGLYWTIGQMKAPFNREELVSSSAQLAVERSTLNNQFTYGWTQGVEVGRQSEDLWLRGWFGDGPNSANQQSQGIGDRVAIVARADLRLDGTWSDWGSFTSRGKGDSAFLGAALQWFNSSARPNTTDYGGYEGNTSYGFTVDGSFTRGNWTAYAAFMWARGSGNTAAIAKSDAWAVLVQGGYMVSDAAQVFGRYELGRIDNYPAGSAGAGDSSILTVGLNVWLAPGRVMKWTTDFGYAFDTLSSGPTTPGYIGPAAGYTSSGNGWRGDAADGDAGQWLVRTQLQLLF